jgi:hypothetical protein
MLDGSFGYFRKHRRIAFLAIFAVAFALRFALLIHYRGDIQTVGEEPLIAYSILHHGTFADPYRVPTGPTAHSAPLFVWLLVAIYKILGTGLLGQFGRGTLVIAGYSTLFALYPTFAEWFGFPYEGGLIAGFLSAVFVIRRSFEVFRGWEESWSGIALALLLYFALKTYRSGRHDVRTAIWFGIAWGLVLYMNFSLSSVLAGLLLVQFLVERSFVVFRNACITVLVIAVVISPWIIRNHYALHGWVLMRSNFGLELRYGNHPGALISAEMMSSAPDSETAHPHPDKDVSEAMIVAQMGELNYMHRDLHLAVTWISEHPSEFAKLTLKRIVFFWCGPLNHKFDSGVMSVYTLLGMIGFFLMPQRVGKVQFRMWCTVFAFYPIIYYIVPYIPRYRVPIDWMIWLPAGMVICLLLEKMSTGRDAAETALASR